MKTSRPWVLGLLVLAALAWGLPGSARAQQVELADVEAMRQTWRWRAELGGGVLSRQPGSLGEPGGVLLLAAPLWYSPAWGQALQLSLDARGVLGLSDGLTMHVGAGLGAGAELFLLRFLSVEVRVGPYLGMQVGRQGLRPMVGMIGGGGWGLRPFQDVRSVLRLGLVMLPAFALRQDPGNDCPMCPSLALTLGVETPWGR